MSLEGQHEVIWLHNAAPTKPVVGQPCNGCGVCCAASPCPVARIVLWQVRGRCRALQWDANLRVYRCGLMLTPRVYVRFLPASWERGFGRWVAGRIAAGVACDSKAEIVRRDVTGV